MEKASSGNIRESPYLNEKRRSLKSICSGFYTFLFNGGLKVG